MFLTVNLLFTAQVFLAQYGFQKWTLYISNIDERLFSILIQVSAASQFSYPLKSTSLRHSVMML